MFDEQTMVEMGKVILEMTPEQRQARAQALSKLIDAEMARRNIAPESEVKQRGRLLQWLLLFKNALRR